MKLNDWDMFRLEDRVLFEAAAAAEIVDAAEAAQDNPNGRTTARGRISYWSIRLSPAIPPVYNSRRIHSALQYQTPDEVYFGTCNRQATGYSKSRGFTPIFL